MTEHPDTADKPTIVGSPAPQPRTFYEFFAGGGMARIGLGPGWQCTFANDFDARKAKAYADNHGADGLVVGDIADVSAADLPGEVDLAWASFPCQDLSVAGAQKGLAKGTRSGTFWSFHRLTMDLVTAGRAPKLIVIENVTGALTANQGRDFGALCSALVEAGYRFGPLVIDAAHFVPQSRPRLFILAARNDLDVPAYMTAAKSAHFWCSTDALEIAVDRLEPAVRARSVWWKLRAPGLRNTSLIDIIEDDGSQTRWDTSAKTAELLNLMDDANLAKVERAKAGQGLAMGTLYRRTRVVDKQKVQRAEVRFDGVAGCLRAPTGGSSRQTLVVVDHGRVRTRLLSAREAARLMGIPEEYQLPTGYNEAYHLVGDGVVAPVVRHLAQHLLEPLLAG